MCTLATSMTRFHSAVVDWIEARICCGVLPTGRAPICTCRAETSGEWTASAIALEMVCTIGRMPVVLMVSEDDISGVASAVQLIGMLRVLRAWPRSPPGKSSIVGQLLQLPFPQPLLHGGGLYPLAALAAPSAAPDFLFGQFTGGAGRWPGYGVIADRWPGYGVIADRWPQPRQADGSESAPRCADLLKFTRTRGDPKIAIALNPHLKVLRVGETGWQRGAGAARSYGVDGDCWPPPRRADGPTQRRALAPTFRAGVMLLFILGAAAPRADRHMVGQQTDPLVPAAGRRRRLFFLV